MRMVGISKTSAPSARRPALKPPACFRVRVTTMRLPKSGRVSNQFSWSRSATTSPKTATAGAWKPLAATFSAMSASVPRSVCCRPVVPQRTSATGVSGAAPCCRKLLGDRADPLHAHEHDLRPRRRRELREIERALRLRRILVPGENGELRRVVAMRHRDARVSRRGDGRADAGDDLETQPRRRERLRLLAAAPEDKRIAALQPHDPLSRPRFFHEQRVDLLLLERVLPRLFARVDDLRARLAPKSESPGCRGSRRRSPPRARRPLSPSK